MKVEQDFEEFVKLLNKHEVKYLIVGAYALALYSEPRNTGDIDFFIQPEKENSQKVLNVLTEFGFESLEITLSDLMNKDMIIQLGIPPVRIDLLTSILGVEFVEAYNQKKSFKFGKQNADFISKELLIKNKKASNRKKDIADLETLLNS